MASGNITAATNASPIVVTSAAHGRTTGDLLNVASVGGNTAANGAWIITKVDADKFYLNNSTGNGAYTSGGTWDSTLIPITITDASNATPIVITDPSHGLVSGISVLVAGVGGNTAANGTWVITVVDANKFILNGSVGNGNYTAGGYWIQVSAIGKTISGATNATPIVITAPGHGLTTGDLVSIGGIAGNDGANSSFAFPGSPVTVIDANSFSVGGSVGTGVYVGGGTITPISISPVADQPVPSGTTSTMTTGTGAIVLMDSENSVLHDGDWVQYSLSQGGIIIESGVGKYGYAANSIVRMGIGNNDGVEDFVPLDLSTGPTTVSFCSIEPSGMGSLPLDPPIPGDNLNVPMWENLMSPPAPTGQFRAMMQRLGVTLSDPLPPNTNVMSQLDLNRLSWEERQQILRTQATRARQNCSNDPANALYSGPGRASARAYGVTALAAGLIAAQDGFPSIQIPLPGVQAGPTCVQGTLSMQDKVCVADGDRTGFNDVIYFVPGQNLAAVDDAIISLYHLTSNQEGWFDFKIVAQRQIIGYRSTGRYGMSCHVGRRAANAGSFPADNRIPFNYDTTKMRDQSKVWAGLPADIFAYIPVYTAPNARPFTQPQMFFLNWGSASSRLSGSKGFRLTGLTQQGIITLKVNGESWVTDNTLRGSGASCDKVYMYLGTIVPLTDGTAVCGPNLRLMINQFNRIAYADSVSETTPYWFVNQTRNTDNSRRYERMNPLSGQVVWGHYFVDPSDANGGIISANYGNRQLQSSAGMLSFSARAGSWGAVSLRGMRSPTKNLITNVSTASPPVVTSVAHGLLTGDIVTIFDVRTTGIGGNSLWRGVNGTSRITKVSADTFSLDGVLAGGATYLEGGYFLAKDSLQLFTSSQGANGVLNNTFMYLSGSAVIGQDQLIQSGLNFVEIQQAYEGAATDQTYRNGFWGASAQIRYTRQQGILSDAAALTNTRIDLGNGAVTDTNCGFRAGGSC